ncbi:MAG: pilus assembly protein [Rhodanobacter sp.]
MTRLKLLLRTLWVCLPIALISGFALVAVSAAPAVPLVTPGKISAKGMSDFEAYPSGVNALAASNPPPLIMLVMSRDEQLFNKAYPDYTDLDNDGKVDTTYLDSFEYNGYFDPAICYVYDTTNGYFKASVAVNAGGHQCGSGTNTTLWSGNFLNWVAMSRVDILRWTFYGGTRRVDTAAKTVLERAEIPNDIHAWPKVYTGSDIGKYAPFTKAMTFCNVSSGSSGSWTKPTTTTSGVGSTPLIRAAAGAWGDWASTEGTQCVVGGDSARPSSATDYTARIQVCQNLSDGTPNEAFCVVEGSALKPEGLLQKYSKSGSNAKRFGLVTGSTAQARVGGQLRRNIGKLQDNVEGKACAAGSGAGDGDEFSNVDGTFCYKSASTTPSEGIVMTLDQLQVKGWTGTNYGTTGNGCYLDASHPWGARGYAIQNNPTRCPDFGNPLASMYATALNYIKGASAPNKETGTLPTPSWVDPYGKLSDGSARNRECASCSIVLVSSGLNTFDAQNVPTVAGVSPVDLTNAIQAKEGIEGKYMLSTYYGSTGGGAPAQNSLTVAGTQYSDATICQPATIGKLSDVVGICNGAPGQQGSYLLAGLSYGAWNVDGSNPIRTTGVVDGFRVKTYGVSLSDNLPAFNIVVGNKTVSLSPSCRADPANTGGFTTCYLGNVTLTPPTDLNKKNVYGLSPTTAYPNVGSYYIMWEDSQYGSDHDMDANNVITWCVGASCNAPSTIVSGGVKICDPEIFNGSKSAALAEYDTSNKVCKANGTLNFVPTDNDIIIRNETTSFSSAGMYLGYQVGGTQSDGLTELYINSGNNAVFGCNLLADAKDCNSKPQVRRFQFGSSANVAASLQTPLWYATKYSGFEGETPTLPADSPNPSNYFFARNAGMLKDQLNTVFQQITSSSANNFGNATTPSSSNDVQGTGLSYQVQYYQERNNVKWTGSLQAFWSDNDGYQREGTTSGTQQLQPDAKYVVAGADKSEGALAGAMTGYRCSVAPAKSDEGVEFDASTNGACSVVSESNPLLPAWDAGSWLNAWYDPTAAAGSNAAKAIANLPKQRSYGNATDLAGNSQRYIFTYLTSKPNGKAATGTVVNGTQTDFVWNDASCNSTGVYTLSATSGFCGTFKSGKRTGNYGLLNELDPVMAKELVNWVRGVEYPDDYRSRTGSTPGDPAKGIASVTRTYRLGDIVDSSPMIVGTPAESYDLLYSDYSFAAFRANYRDRRQMVYVGANDGMLHAFNGGFYMPGQYDADPDKIVYPSIVRQLPADKGLKTGNSSVPLGNNWQLGQEVWAYIPQNLLPHLRWLADKNYSHVFYVDGAPVVSDVQAFGSTSDPTTAACKAGTSTTADSKGHICGWGTVMVVPFRLGGGAISVDTVGDAKDASIEQSNSAYVILDVTDPEQPPTVLGEITMGTYTTAAPAFSVHREADGKLHYLLTIGSGPVDNGGPNGSSGDKPVAAANGSKLEVRVYDLADIVAKKSAAVATLSTGPDNSFAGDMVASDFDLNNSSEAVYFGVVTNPSDPDLSKATGVFGGGLWKLDMNTAPADEDGNAATVPDTSDPGTWKLEQVIDTEQPVTIRPTLALDPTGRAMVYFGTGRSFTTNDDSGSSYQGVQQQYIYGVSDNSLLSWLSSDCKEMPATGPLFDASTIEVAADDNSISGLPEDVDALKDATTLDALAGVLTSIDKDTGCYAYSGWKMKLAAGDRSASVQQPSERIVSSQVLYNGILLTPSYIPANLAARTAAKQSECNPVPVPGTSNLYGMNYVTGTADPSLAKTFGSSGGNISRKVGLGSGKASSPVLHVGNGKVTAAFGISGGTKLQQIGALGAASNGEISWREPMDNQ